MLSMLAGMAPRQLAWMSRVVAGWLSFLGLDGGRVLKDVDIG